MALDLHILKDGQPADLLFQIERERYERMLGAFILFKEKTGIFIDEYSDTKLNSNLALLIQVLSDMLSTVQEPIVSQDLDTLIVVLKKAESQKFSVIFVGD